MNLRELDLNLLVVLDALLRERSVSRAAVAVGLTQPATSNALARLRVALSDPLFTRGRQGMTPTPRALALQGPVADALARLRSALDAPAPFDPQKSARTFVLAASDHAQLIIVPELVSVLERTTSLNVRIVPLPEIFPQRALETGELDLVIGIFDLAPGDRVPKGLKRQRLVEERFVAVARRDHALFRRPLELATAAALPQLHVAPRGGTKGTYEQKLLKGGLRRNIRLFTPHYLVAPWVLASTDLVATLPERLARRFAEVFPLRTAPLPFAVAPLKVHQVWHPRAQDDPAHRWLRAEVLRCARAAATL